MSDFRFSQPGMPRRVTFVVGYGLAAFITLLAIWLLSGLSDRRDAMAQMRAIIARADMVEATGSGNAALGPDTFYTGDTPQLAQAALQTNLQTLAESFRIEIEVIRADQIEQVDNFVRLNLTLNGVAPEEELGNFLRGLAALRPLVVVEELTLRRARSSRSDADRQVSFHPRRNRSTMMAVLAVPVNISGRMV